jgi:hypothetical protein
LRDTLWGYLAGQRVSLGDGRSGRDLWRLFRAVLAGYLVGLPCRAEGFTGRGEIGRVRMEIWRWTDDLTKSSSPGSGRVEKGTVNVAKMGTAACKSRTVLTARKGSSRGGLPQMPW